MFSEGRIGEYLIVGIVALIVVGPKDLPILMRKVGQFLAHMRGMAAEFRASFDEMARQSELDELRREVDALRSGRTLQTATGLGPGGGVHEVFSDIHTSLRDTPAEPPAPGPEPHAAGSPVMTALPPAPAEPAATAEAVHAAGEAGDSPSIVPAPAKPA